LAVSPGHFAMLVADNDQRVEAETPAALHDRRAPPNLDDTLFHAVLSNLTVPSHSSLLGSGFNSPDDLKLQSPFASGVGQGFDPAVVAVVAAVEGHFADAFGLGSVGQLFTDRLRRVDIAAVRQTGAN